MDSQVQEDRDFCQAFELKLVRGTHHSLVLLNAYVHSGRTIRTMEIDMKNLLTVATLIYAIAGTAAAQAQSETREGLIKVPSIPGGALIVVYPGGGGTGVAPPIFASVDLVCGGKTYTVSTGNKSGECKTGGNGNNAICDDGHGNGAEVLCSSGCKSANGSGSCTAKAQ
jgi:hypothetical protein